MGKPILGYPIEAALESGLFETVMVSTDSEKIASIAKDLGAEVPFYRSQEASNDHATTADALTEVLLQYSEKGRTFDNACCCYPASPFITAAKLQTAYELLIKHKADAVIPIVEYATPIFRAFEMNDHKVRFLWPEYTKSRSQDLPPTYFDDGQFYFFGTQGFLRKGHFLTDNTVGMPLPASEAEDIDTEDDWKLAELKYSIWQDAL